MGQGARSLAFTDEALSLRENAEWRYHTVALATTDVSLVIGGGTGVSDRIDTSSGVESHQHWAKAYVAREIDKACRRSAKR